MGRKININILVLHFVFMSSLDVKTISKVYDIFSRKSWVHHLGHYQVHERLCELLARLQEDEKELMLELFDRYDWITLNDYGKYVLEIFEGLRKKSVIPKGRIYLFPLKSIEDRMTSKSADTLIYMFQGFINLLTPPFNQPTAYTIIEGLEKTVADTFVLKTEDAFFVMDDFLGTGDSLFAVLDEIKQGGKVAVEKIVVLALVAHENALERLKKMGIQYSVALVRKKGITDYYEEPTLSERISSMKKIERRITTNKRLLFGYKKSEGLVTMIRTPNNTFPVFWMSYKVGNFRLDPPFPRFQITKI